MPKPLAAEIRESDNGIQLVFSVSKEQIDPLSLALIQIDFEHHELHEGHHFFYTDSVELASGVSQDYLITTPNTDKWSHATFELDGSAITQFQIYEGANRTGTTLQTTFNNNRNSSNTPGMTIHKGTSGGSTDGTLIRQYKGGRALGNSQVPTGNRNELELILKAGTKYILRVTSGTAANLTNVGIYWYEVVSGES